MPPKKRSSRSARPSHGDQASASTIRWKKYPGGAAKICQTPGGGPYAKSEDDRFVVWVSRYRRGDRGYRSYSYHYRAVDYGLPSGEQRFTDIPIHLPGTFPVATSTNVRKVMAAVDRWALLHPLT